MWDIENRSPFPAHGCFLRDHTGRTLWCLFIKASFTIRPGQPCLFATTQEPIFQGPVSDASGLVADTDLTLPKPRCDLVIDALAYPAPEKEQARVSASVGGWRKEIVVHPSRNWTRWRGASQDGQPQAPVALRYDNAFGGPDFAGNPIGIGHADRPQGRLPVPRLARPGATRFDPRRGEPVALSAIPRDWPQRAQFAGTYDDTWRRRRAPMLPADLDPRYWQSVPEDQHLPSDDVAGHTLRLAGMTPDGSELAIPIPDPRFQIATRFRARWIPQQQVLQTVFVSVPRNLLTLCWTAALPIEAVQNDVLVDRSAIALTDAGGFHIRSTDTPFFADAGMQV